MVKIYFDKLYRYPRIDEHAFVAIPLPQGKLYDLDKVAIFQDGNAIPVQKKVTSKYKDGSIRYMFIRFMANLPANRGCELDCDLDSDVKLDYDGMQVVPTPNGFKVESERLTYEVENNSANIFKEVTSDGMVYAAEQFVGPKLLDKDGRKYDVKIGTWKVVEEGPLVSILMAEGSNVSGDLNVDFEIKITAYAKKPWVEISYRIINTTERVLNIDSLVFYVNAKGKCGNLNLKQMNFDSDTDSTGCGDGVIDNSNVVGPLFHTRGIGELSMLEEKASVKSVRTCVGSSNYKTDFYIGKDGEEVNKIVNAHFLTKEANEHFEEVFYGTFFADRTDENGGVCATIFQAQQNYPKAVKADENGIALMLVPKDVDFVTMQMGMSREQKFLLHFHNAKESLIELDNRSLIYQMPDRPHIDPKVFKDANVFIDVFNDVFNENVEISMIAKADGHARCYGMLNWGDAPDQGYTLQGRGNGEQVWVNNEYDYPHACAMMYARTGVRRFLDYNFVSVSHWMDVDVCHYHTNPLYMGGQWEHTAGHCKNGVMVCSHEWVEGLLDYYHFSGDERGLQTALGIGDNVLKLLDTPMYQVPGEANARETGWALRTLVALYVETNDEKWLGKCQWILDSFYLWEEQYGGWLAPYTDNTVIRVGFMIGVAVGSVMRYYRIFPDEKIKKMLLGAIDDVVENCLLPNGLFYYKELPSLTRNGNNTLLLELLAIGFELTGDVKYLSYGLRTFQVVINAPASGPNGKKQIIGDAVIKAGASPKGFAQCFLPLMTFYKAVSDNYDKLQESGYLKNHAEYDILFT